MPSDCVPTAPLDAGRVADLLDEGAERYRHLAQSEAIQARSFKLLECARAGADQVLLPYILEEIRVAHTAYALAAAATALTCLTRHPPGAADLLADAELRLGLQDRIVDLDCYPPRPGQGRSAKAILKAAREDLMSVKPCCASAEVEIGVAPDSLKTLADLGVQDQDGQMTSFGALTEGFYCLIAFFYTRCGNPLKCSQTVSLLGATYAAAQSRGMTRFRAFGISYDPAYDLPDRLLRYGQDRSVPFGDGCRLLRIPDGMAEMHKALNLGVGYSPGTVNAHRLEWLLTDPSGRICQSGARRHWDSEALLSVVSPATHRIAE